MGWLTAIKNLLLNLPKILAVGEAIIAAFKSIASYFQRKAAKEEQEKAVDKAKETKDTSDVEAIFNPGTGSSGASDPSRK